MNRLKNTIKKVITSIVNYDAFHSYSQSGEDLIISFIFNNFLGIPKPTYLDIGAHHPSYLSNTYLFYQRGCSGVCVEPDPTLFSKIQKKRKRDICLNVGVGLENKSEDDFYIMTTKTLNTFSKEEAIRYQSYGRQKIEKVIKIPMVPVNDIIGQYFSKTPNLISLDVEGLDYQILNTFDFSRYRPEVMCIETLTYTEDQTERKIRNIIDLMLLNDYFVYADTYINTIFIDKKAWSNRKEGDC